MKHLTRTFILGAVAATRVAIAQEQDADQQSLPGRYAAFSSAPDESAPQPQPQPQPQAAPQYNQGPPSSPIFLVSSNGYKVYAPHFPGVCDATKGGNAVHLAAQDKKGEKYHAILTTMPSGRAVVADLNKNGITSIPDKKQRSAVKDEDISGIILGAKFACLETGALVDNLQAATSGDQQAGQQKPRRFSVIVDASPYGVGGYGGYGGWSPFYVTGGFGATGGFSWFNGGGSKTTYNTYNIYKGAPGRGTAPGRAPQRPTGSAAVHAGTSAARSAPAPRLGGGSHSGGGHK